ncbi:unnamed protein product [Dimorphilus gyrociliatus]|uniref:Uncharacterized protein n=1 Tax=Dimorphilus gyrociliatus TaxID=2664684 RepID=A0A7I8VYF5_9ANNE|nr:unnamed protein product [Dimorphilus gyrociliatus]
MTTFGLLFNLLLALTWTPMTLCIHQIYIKPIKYRLTPDSIKAICRYKLKVELVKLSEKIAQLVSKLIFKFRYIWIGLYLMCGIGSCYILLWGRPLKLSDRKRQLLFSENNLLEKYQDLRGKVDTYKMPLAFVWGIVEDVKSYPFLKPLDKISGKVDKRIDVFNPETVRDLQLFCYSLRKEFNITNYPCLIDTLLKYGSRECSRLPLTFSPDCCNWKLLNGYKFFENCYERQLNFLIENKLLGHQLGNFAHGDNYSSSIFSYSFITNQDFTPAYNEIAQFYRKVQAFWVKNSKKGKLRYGFFWSKFELFDLQRTLLTGVGSSLAIALSGTAIVLILSTRKLCISVISITSLASSVLITISVLALMNWKIGVSDTVCLALGAGLSVDFILHISVLQAKLDTSNLTDQPFYRVQATVDRIGMAVCLAALTSIGTSLISYCTDIHALRRFSLMIFISVAMGCISALVMLCLFSILLTLSWKNILAKLFVYCHGCGGHKYRRDYCYSPTKSILIEDQEKEQEEVIELVQT